MKDLEQIKTIRNHALAFISEGQAKNGSFISLSSSKPNDFAQAKKHQTTFLTSLVLQNIASQANKREIGKVKTRGLNFLLGQASPGWSYNYWQRQAPENKTFPYPDDLDDTMAALIAIASNKPQLIDGSTMAAVVSTLTVLETKEGGPYRTWLVPAQSPAEWLDVDVVVNANIAYLLSLHGVTLPRLEEYIEEQIRRGHLKSPYYPSEYAGIYFISRFYKGLLVDELLAKLRRNQKSNGSWGNPLDTILAATALLNFGVAYADLWPTVDYLSDVWNKEYWQAYAFCLDPEIKGVPYYAGSEVLTASFAVQFVDKFIAAATEGRPRAAKSFSDKEAVELYQATISAAQDRFAALGEDFSAAAHKILASIIRNDTDRQIVLLAYHFWQSLPKGKKAKIPSGFIAKLCMANLYGWLAYRIYDDFLDEEGEPIYLSVANVCLRELSHIYGNLLPKRTGFHILFNEVIDKIDQANLWEVKNFHFADAKALLPDDLAGYGDYQNLANRSLGHILPTMAILYSLGLGQTKQVSHLKSYFSHYLIARQLNDDAHDWLEDLERGQLNSVGLAVVKKAQAKGIVKKLSIANLIKHSHELQQLFWAEVVDDVCRDIFSHVRRAKKELSLIKVLSEVKYFLKILEPIKKSAQEAIGERNKTIDFLRNI